MTDLSLYDQTSKVSNLATFNYVEQANGYKYVTAPAGALGANSLYTQVTVLKVGKPNEDFTTTAKGIPAGEKYAGAPNKEASVHLMVDTGSWQTVIPESVILKAMPDFDPTKYPTANISYSSSNNSVAGVWVPVELQITTTSGEPAIAKIPVIVDLGPDPAMMMGIGFNVARGDPTATPEVTTAGNAFLNLKAMADGSMLRGYVIDGTGIHLGLSASDVGDKWAFQKLQPSARATPNRAPLDWQPSTISGTLGDKEIPSGNLLMDTGLFNTYVKTTNALAQPGVGTPVTFNFLGTGGAVGYSYLLDGTSPLAPLPGSKSPALLTGTSDTGTFVNTGEHFLSGFDYLYDASNGYLGMRPNGSGAGADVRFSQLLSVSGTLPMDNGYATALPVLLLGDTDLVLAGTSTLSGGLQGSGAVSVKGGTLNLSGTSTFKGTVTVKGSGSVLSVAGADTLGAADNKLVLKDGATVVLPPGTSFAHKLSIHGSGTVDVPAGGDTALSGKVEVPDDGSAMLTVGGGGTLHLAGGASAGLDRVVVTDGGTLLVLDQLGKAVPNVQLGDGTTLAFTGATKLRTLSAAGSATVQLGNGANVTLEGGFANAAGTAGVATFLMTSTPGQGSIKLPNGSSHGITLGAGNRVTVGTEAQLNGSTLASFKAGDVIDVTDLSPTGGAVTGRYDPASGTLVLRQGGRVVSSLRVPNAPQGEVTISLDATGGALVEIATPTGNGGDLALRGPEARAAAGVDGTGVSVGVISDSFNTLGGMAQDQRNGELPSSTRVLSDLSSRNTDEGREMAQLIHRIAPGSSILFATAATRTNPGTGVQSDDQEQQFANAINLLVKNGAQVVVDDMRIYQEAYWQPGGPAAQAIAAATAQGVVFVTSAGNSGKAFYESTLVLRQASLPTLGTVFAYDFNGGKGTPNYLQHIRSGSNDHTIDLQWAQPQGSKAFGLTLQVFRLKGDGSFEAVKTTTPEAGTSRTISFSGVQDFYVAVTSTRADATGLFKYVLMNDGGATIDDPYAGKGSGSIFGHKLDGNEITVGAVDYRNTPASGGTPVNEIYSSYGPGEYLFDASGNPLPAPRVLGKPDVSGVDALPTDTSGESQAFGGTSAAAPSVAAVVALMLQANPDLSAAEVKAILKASALPMPGTAVTAGAGLVQADAALALSRPPALSSLTTEPGTSGVALGVGQAVTFTLRAGSPIFATAAGDGSLPNLVLNDGGTAVLDMAASARGALVFRTTVTAGQDTANLSVTALVLNGATIANAGGLKLASTSVATLPGAATGLVVDTTGPGVTLALSSEGVPGGAAPIVSGRTDAGAIVMLRAGDAMLGSVTAGADGRWSLGVPALADGPALLAATAIDRAGNSATAILPVSFAGGAAGTSRVAAAGEILTAGSGPDTLLAGGAGVHLVGGVGRAQLQGSIDGSSTLSGGTGGTLFVARGGQTLIQGGTGHDTVRAAAGDVTVASGTGGSLVTLGSGRALVFGQGPDTISAGSGQATVGAAANSLVALGTGTATVLAGSGSTVVGGAGTALIGGLGSGITFHGGSGQSLFIGGGGQNTVIGGAGSATVMGGTGGGLFGGGANGNNVLVAGEGATTLFGGGNGDVLFAAGPVGDVLVAGSGNETLQGAGSTGDNTFFAGSGNTLMGLGAGHDVVFAGAGASTVVAGTGAGTFAVTNGAAGGTQTILGFRLGTDRLSLQGFGAGEGNRALAGATVAPGAGGTTISLSDNTRITFVGLGSLNGQVFE